MAYRHSLARYSTTELLRMLRSAYRIHGGDPRRISGMHSEDYGYDNDYGPSIPAADLRTELAGREHVPNKMERKKIRQDAARAAKSHRRSERARKR